jgi:hypothetical protein
MMRRCTLEKHRCNSAMLNFLVLLVYLQDSGTSLDAVAAAIQVLEVCIILCG